MKTLITASIITASIVTASANASDPVALKGALVSSVNQIQPMLAETNSNAYMISPATPADITSAIESGNGATAMIGILHMLLDENGWPSGNNMQPIISAINQYSGNADVYLVYDEPLWRSMMLCRNGAQDHCSDNENNFSAMLSALESIDSQIISATGAKSFHVEGYPVVHHQYNSGRPMVMMSTSHLLGVDCYTGFDSCGDPENGFASIYQYNAQVYGALHAMESADPIGRKMAIVPGTYTYDGLISQWQSAQYLSQYRQLLDDPGIRDKVGLVGFFSWGDVGEEGNKGATNYPVLKSIMAEEW